MNKLTLISTIIISVNSYSQDTLSFKHDNILDRYKKAPAEITLASSFMALAPSLLLKSYTFKHKIPMDAKKHFFGSAAITVITSATYRQITGDSKHSLLVGAASSLLITVVGKELIHDKLLGNGVMTKNDIKADILGTITGALYFRVYIGRRIKCNRVKPPMQLFANLH